MSARLFYILLYFVFTCTAPSFAQKQKQVLGKITDSTGYPLQGVSIQLSAEGLKDTLQTVSDKKGSFNFTVSSSKFSITASASEFKSFTQQYKFNSAFDILHLGDIILVPLYKTLNSVEVNVSAITLKEDTIEYKASLFKVKEDATVEDILKKLPGLEVNKNGNITAQGKPVYKIKLNGKDFFGNDVKMATRELPANIIDKIQVIDDHGDAAAKTGIKTDEPVKIINLQLKKDKSKGMFGNAATGHGSLNSYQAKLNANYFSDKTQLFVFGKSNNINNGFVITGKNNAGVMAGATAGNAGPNMNPGIQQNNSGIPDGITTTHTAGVNFRVDFGKQNTFYGSYNYTNRKTAGKREQYAQFIYPVTTYFNNQEYDYTNRGNNHQLSLNLEVFPDSMSYLKISPEIFFNNSNIVSNTDFSFLNNNQKTREGFMRDSGKMRTPAIGLNILYNRYFHKKGRNFSISLNPSFVQSDNETYRPSFTRIYDTPGNYQDSIQDQQLYQKNNGFNYDLSLSYTEPVFKDRYLDLTYRHDFSKANNEQKVYSMDTGSTAYQFNAGLSNQFTNRFNGDNIGLSFRTVKIKYNYTLGVSLMPVNIKNYSGEKDTVNKPQRTLNVSPLARFSYAFSRSKNLSISYRGSTRQPSALQLQPVRDISNQQFQKEGNPGLKPEFSHSVNLSYNSFSFTSASSLFSSIGFNTIQHKIVNNSILLDTSGTQLSRPQNLNGFYSINGFYNYSKAFDNNKYAIKANGYFQYFNDAVLANSEKVSGNNLLLSQGLEFTYNNNKWLEIGIEAVYTLTSVTNLISKANRSNTSTWALCNNLNMNLPWNTVIKYDFEKLINIGFDESINRDINLLNISVEKKLLKKKSLYISLAGYNILNQNFSLNRQVIGNSIIDTRTLQLARYFICTLTYKWNKFGK